MTLPSLEPFHGDFAELSALMQASWAENILPPLLYTEAFLASTLDQPGASLDLCPALYENGALIAFGAGLPRTVRFMDRTFRLLLDSFITVAPTHKGRGLGGVIWNGIAEAAKHADREGLITFCVEGDRMNASLPRFAADFGLPTHKSFTVNYLARPVPKPGTAKLERADASLLQQTLAETISFVREWTPAEADWQCNGRLGAFGAAVGQSTIAAYTMPYPGPPAGICGLVDDVFWNDAAPAEQKELVEQLMISARAAQVDLLLVPMLRYFDTAPFRAAGFRQTRRTLNMYLTSLNPAFVPTDLESAYIDVF